MNNGSHYYLNKGATLVIKRDDVFKNKNYMKDDNISVFFDLINLIDIPLIVLKKK